MSFTSNVDYAVIAPDSPLIEREIRQNVHEKTRSGSKPPTCCLCNKSVFPLYQEPQLLVACDECRQLMRNKHRVGYAIDI